MKVLGPGERSDGACVVTVGAFDGIHRGHRVLIDEVRRRADAEGCASAVVTFDRHPAQTIRPQRAPNLLVDSEQKLELFESTGIDYLVVLPFDDVRAAESAEDFVDEVLVAQLQARAVVVGYDFRFGRGREGDVALLTKLGKEAGFRVGEVEPLLQDDEVISSTAVRAALVAGDVTSAAMMLGRPYEMRGTVMHGDGRGRELGFPTANVHVADEIVLPAVGVYAGTYVLPSGEERRAALSLGTRPHFYEDGVNLLEAFLLDFDADLYDQPARIRFVKRIRGQAKFPTLEALVARMGSDVDQIREILA
jgi:riboflavin kinase / FMN adenylyltransferase